MLSISFNSFQKHDIGVIYDDRDVRPRKIPCNVSTLEVTRKVTINKISDQIVLIGQANDITEKITE